MGRIEKDYTKKALCPILLTGSNSKKPLTQNNVNKDHVFIKKKKKLFPVFHHIKGQILHFLDTPNVIGKMGQTDKRPDSEWAPQVVQW